MKYQPALMWLIPLIGLLAVIASGVGLFWQPVSFSTGAAPCGRGWCSRTCAHRLQDNLE